MTIGQAHSIAPNELCVMLELGALVCALPTRLVERLVLLDEAQLLDPNSSTLKQTQGRTFQGILEAFGQRFVAWDLAELLGLGRATPKAWVLMQLAYRDTRVPIALRTGTCLVIEPIGPSRSIPPATFGGRHGALKAGFTLSARSAASGAVLGLYLDAAALWTQAELALSAECIRELRAAS